MELQPSAIPKASWRSLPPELRLMVLRELKLLEASQPCCETGLPVAEAVPTPRYTWARYAMVNKEFRAFFEAISFGSLYLSQEDLPYFGSIMQGERRTFVRHIGLRVHLPTYDCSRCRTPESAEETRENNTIFTNAVWDLMTILSHWSAESFGSPSKPKKPFTLELGAFSPSDGQHLCKNLQLHMSDLRPRCHPRLVELRELPEIKRDAEFNMSHYWNEKGNRVKNPHGGARQRLFGHPDGLTFDWLASPLAASSGERKRLPDVSVVTCLTIPRSHYRYISVPEALEPLIGSLTQLEALRYEPWRGIKTRPVPGRTIRDIQHRQLLDLVKAKQSLECIYMIESFSKSFHFNTGARCSPALGRALARASRNMKSIVGAFNVDARDFFHEFWSNSKNGGGRLSMEPPKRVEWKNLETLCLTSATLNPRDCDRLLLAAAAAAKRMPMLRFLELWNATGKTGHACYFRWAWTAKDGGSKRASIRLQTSWGIVAPCPVVLRRWQEVTDVHGIHSGLQVLSNRRFNWRHTQSLCPASMLFKIYPKAGQFLSYSSSCDLAEELYWNQREYHRAFHVGGKPEDEDYFDDPDGDGWDESD